jgi:hypothetical protein
VKGKDQVRVYEKLLEAIARTTNTKEMDDAPADQQLSELYYPKK